MPVIIEKKKENAVSVVLAAAKKLSPEEKQLLKLKLFGSEAIEELKTFEAAIKKRKPLVKKTDAEIVAAVKKIRLRNAAE